MEGVAAGFSICFEKIYSWFIRADAEVILITEMSVYTRAGDVVLYLAVLVLSLALGRKLFRE